MSLYYVQKLLYDVNRDEGIKKTYLENVEQLMDGYRLTDEERAAIAKPDIGLLYVLGVNGQILSHFATHIGISWDDYLNRMRKGVEVHGQVRAGLYRLTGDGKSFTEKTEVKPERAITSEVH